MVGSKVEIQCQVAIVLVLWRLMLKALMVSNLVEVYDRMLWRKATTGSANEHDK